MASSVSKVNGSSTPCPCSCSSWWTVVQGMGTPPHLGGPIRREQEQTRRFPPTRQDGQQVQGGGVAPVQVFEHQHQRLLGGQPLQGLGELPEHPFPRRPASAAPQRLQVSGRDQARHLHQPGRRLLPQERHPPLPAGAPTHASQRLQHRQIRFPHPVVLHALPVPDPQGPLGAKLPHKGIHQRGLAQARLARDEDHLADAMARLGEPAVETGQFLLPPDRRDRTAPCGWRTARWRSGTVRRERLPHLHRRHKAIALAVQRPHEARGSAPLPQRLAQRLDTGFQHLVPDKLLRPQVLQEFLLGDHPLAMRQEVGQHLKGLAPQLDRRPGAMQLGALGVQDIVTKAVPHCPALLSTLEPLRPQDTRWAAVLPHMFPTPYPAAF